MVKRLFRWLGRLRIGRRKTQPKRGPIETHKLIEVERAGIQMCHQTLIRFGITSHDATILKAALRNPKTDVWEFDKTFPGAGSIIARLDKNEQVAANTIRDMKKHEANIKRFEQE